MNLIKLLELQQKLRDRIDYNESDRFDKLILATIVETGEAAQMWRSFKYWSKDQEPRRVVEAGICTNCAGTGDQYYDDPEAEEPEACHKCNGEGEELQYPLLEEYVDGLHFILELGLEINFEHLHLVQRIESDDSILKLFIEVTECIITFSRSKHSSHYRILLETYLLLGNKLGYTENEIERAYLEKNKINHIRQNRGY
ncbi:dUTP diphosphatase (plasmid) [Rossellomorea sp. AcN35-11]|nr:dUTP diphosphatase [Rossellomorea aquimaris]WJV31874.1 dUTP diphosphatase [Rossellomorea sp. AcN35-11]